MLPSLNAAHPENVRCGPARRGVCACVKNRGGGRAALGTDLTGNAVSHSGNVIRESTAAVCAVPGPEAGRGAVRLAPPGRRWQTQVFTKHLLKAGCKEYQETTNLPGGVREVIDHLHCTPSFNRTSAHIIRPAQ